MNRVATTEKSGGKRLVIVESPAKARTISGYLGDGFTVASSVGVAEGGYRVIFNTGPNSGQEVAHVHAHVLGGAPLGPMVCQ